MRREIVCPKCKFTSGDDWTQCNGACPMDGSPHYSAELAAQFNMTPSASRGTMSKRTKKTDDTTPTEPKTKRPRGQNKHALHLANVDGITYAEACTKLGLKPPPVPSERVMVPVDLLVEVGNVAGVVEGESRAAMLVRYVRECVRIEGAALARLDGTTAPRS